MDLKRRGLKVGSMVLGVLAGLPGLERVFEKEFPKAVIQHCQVNLAGNALAKMTEKLKKIADEIGSIFYASSKGKTLEVFL